MAYLETIPPEIHGLSAVESVRLFDRLRLPLRRTLKSLQIADLDEAALRHIHLPLAATLAAAAARQKRPLLVGVNGAQGSGKTTLCRLLEVLLKDGFGLQSCTLSIDDLYLTRVERRTLAQTVHPLFATRGVPGTHDVRLGMQLLEELSTSDGGRQVSLPVFDKAADDRKPKAGWRRVATPVNVLLFEGWCVGARPQSPAALRLPVNFLEEWEDSQGIWRRHVNDQLAGPYRDLFAMLDRLIMLEVPDMECVFAWRSLQEEKLARQVLGQPDSRLMDRTALRRFIMHYERLTRQMLAEMPARAGLVLRLNQAHQIDAVRVNHWS